ncbi:DUF262 domain-containing protein [Streptomyces griseoaurantiacus]|uniref:DUF262 domain-containing protein n=1 Tax=Streptomyces griseoaurantiacus TaxID=68213 RepID=UPI003683F043
MHRENDDAEGDDAAPLGGAEAGLRERWFKKKSNLFSHALDFNLSTLISLVQADELDLDPEYARRYRWDVTRKSRLIESFLLEVPVPPIFLAENTDGRYSIIDGKQRVSSIVEFTSNGFPLTDLEVLPEANGLTFEELDPAMARSLLSRSTLRAVIIAQSSDPDMKYAVFARLNTGGVHLTAQEIRNALHPGPFNRMLVSLSVEPKFQSALQIGSASQRDMRDVELVLRYFALRDFEGDRAPLTAEALTRSLMHGNALSESEIQADRDEFLSSLSKCSTAFGPLAFRRWDPRRGEATSRTITPLYDAEMAAVRGFREDALARRAVQIQQSLKDLLSRPEFQRSQHSPGSSFEQLTNGIINLLHRVLG